MNNKTLYDNELNGRPGNGLVSNKIKNMNVNGVYLSDDDTENIIQILDVPIYVRYNTISSTSASTGPSTPNSREYEQFDVKRNNGINNDMAFGMRSTVPSNTVRNNDFIINGNNSGLLKGQVKYNFGLLDNPHINLNFFNFKIVKKKSYFSSNALLKNNDRILIEMTKPNDFSFLLNCNLSDGNDFLYLKSEQRLLVDFQEFPAMLIDLLNRSKYNFDSQISDNSKKDVSLNTGTIGNETRVFPGLNKQELIFDNAKAHNSGNYSANNGNSLKIVLNINNTEVSGGCDTNIGLVMNNLDSCVLHFVELNHYKEIVHLSLHFETANELLFRNHILNHLNYYYELSKKQQILIHNNEYEINKLKNDLLDMDDKLKKSSYLSVKNEKELSEKYEIDIRRLIDKYELDYNQLKYNYEAKYKNELELWSIERVNNENKINELQKQFNDLGNIFNNINKSKLDLEKLIDDDQKIISELKTKLDNQKSSYDILLNLKIELEAEINDLKVKYNNVADTNNNFKNDIEIKQKEINELDNALDDACKEIDKGNHIITSLQDSLNNVDSKYKQQMINYNNLKRNYQEVEIDNKNMTEKLKDYEQLLDDSNNRQEQLINENERLRKALIEAEKQIEINQNIISSLKKQISMNESGNISNYRGVSLYNDYHIQNSNKNVASYYGTHYTLNSNLPQSIASISASRRSSILNSTSRSFIDNRKKQVMKEDVFDANSISRKYSKTVNNYPKRSYTWSMESVNHQSKESNIENKNMRNSSTGRILKKNGSDYGDLIKNNKNNDSILSSSIFTPPSNRITNSDINAGNLKSKTTFDLNDSGENKWYSHRMHYYQANDYLHTLDELESENMDNISRELTTPRLKTPVKPIISDNNNVNIVNGDISNSRGNSNKNESNAANIS
ncbi:putative large low complexity coiled coil [Cryptosporidium bovis]|uniref:putative large low complexity coiled coil n=1 Tax=Cryptosporidium bovis TaxID=310047 RepID=UPI00351A542C|nr:putative large low complexity coiled coil [Cryptosporidium bovis]